MQHVPGKRQNPATRMIPGGIPPGGVDLTRSGQIAVQSMEVWPAALIDFHPSGIAGLPGDKTMRLINVQRGAVVLLPYDADSLRKLHDSLGTFLQQTEGNDGQD